MYNKNVKNVNIVRTSFKIGYLIPRRQITIKHFEADPFPFIKKKVFTSTSRYEVGLSVNNVRQKGVQGCKVG